jgi:hypothetical protein
MRRDSWKRRSFDSHRSIPRSARGIPGNHCILHKKFVVVWQVLVRACILSERACLSQHARHTRKWEWECVYSTCVCLRRRGIRHECRLSSHGERTYPACAVGRTESFPCNRGVLHEAVESYDTCLCGECRGSSHAQGAGLTPQAYSAEQVASPRIVAPCSGIEM